MNLELADIMEKITIRLENPYSEAATHLMDELSASLHTITGDSGKSSFDLNDVCIPRSAFVIARSVTGEALGCGAIRPIDEGIAEVKRMYSKIKRNGLGGQILEYLERHAMNLGYSALCLETRKMNQAAVSFYLHHGYSIIPNYGRYIGRSEAICFEKKLK